MNAQMLGVIILCGTMLAGCVTKSTHEATLTELDQAQKASSKMAADFDSFKKQSAAQIAALEADKSQLSNDLLNSQTASAKLQRELDKARSSLDTTLASRNDMEQDVRKIRAESSGMERLNGELRREREQLQDKLDALQKNYDATKQDLETKLKAEQDTVAALQNDKQLLIARATGATDELAKLQKRMGELETDASRAKDLEQRLSQRDIELGKLTQGGETLAAEKERLAAEKERLEKERAAKQAEIDRLTKTQQELTKSLQAEIERGDITIKQVRDRLTINMVEKVLFNSGQAQVKPAGLKVLTQVSDVLKNVTDKQIRIEGHTDNVPIGVKLQEKFPTNWELSTARATNVVRFFIDRGGVNRERLEAVGFADTRPVAGNETEAGRTDNRRIEIVLYPKDLSEIVGEAKP
ncbi:MAG TPA: OmpA family protein [Nitrospira sp.]|nr:OmpA family protein [Nitrospira sp.]